MSQTKIDTVGILTNLPLFRQLDADEIARLADACRLLRPAKGDIVLQKGEPPHGFYVVVYGRIKLAFPSEHGAEKVVRIIEPGQTFAEAMMFLEKPLPVFGQALADSLLLHLPKQAIFTAIERDPAFARKMLAGLSIRLHDLIQDVEAYSLRSGTQRLIGYLLQNEHDARTEVNVELPASKQIIASRLNLTPETLSRILLHLVEAALIRVDGRHIVIHDVDALRRYER